MIKNTLAVVIPAFNAERWIACALDSALGQSRAPDEVIVIDDGSTDRTVEIVRGFGRRVILKCVNNGGAARARNIGLSSCRSSLVFFLDADDYVEGNFFGGALDAISQCNADIAFAPVYSERSDGSRSFVFHYHLLPAPLEIFSAWLESCSQPPCSIIWRAEFLRNIGAWDERISVNDDGELMMRAMLFEPTLTSFSTAWGVYRAHDFPSLSKRRCQLTLQQEFEGMTRLLHLAHRLRSIQSFPGFHRKIYNIARCAFELSDVELGRSALRTARQLGFRGHSGTACHRLASTILGLENKTRLARMLKVYAS